MAELSHADFLESPRGEGWMSIGRVSRGALEKAPAHEIKLELANSRASAVAAFLTAHCRVDAEHPGGRVSTIYYDTPDLCLLGEKKNSDFLKTKVRLRWYGDPTGPLFLEVKRKVGQRRFKERLVVAAVAAQVVSSRLESRAFAEPLDRLRERTALPPFLRPLLELRYRRRRFVDPVSGTRIALDTDIRVVRINSAILSRFDSTPLRSAVLEAKGANASAPDFFGPLVAFGCRRSAFSKYLHCYLQAAA
jgi:hypothetical protein